MNAERAGEQGRLLLEALLESVGCGSYGFNNGCTRGEQAWHGLLLAGTRGSSGVEWAGGGCRCRRGPALYAMC